MEKKDDDEGDREDDRQVCEQADVFHAHPQRVKESGRPDSNRRRPAWEAGILPLNYARVTSKITNLQRVAR